MTYKPLAITFEMQVGGVMRNTGSYRLGVQEMHIGNKHSIGYL